MRMSLISGLGAMASIAIATLASPVPAHADPAYTAKKVLDAFIPAVQAKMGPSRGFCVKSQGNCDGQAQPIERFDLLVNFEFDSDRLTAPAKENLSEFAKALLDPHLKGQKFAIDGYTDASGAEQYNLGLSERRANAVVSFLGSQGVDPATLVPKGFGKSNPRAADPFSPENRRVETHLPQS